MWLLQPDCPGWEKTNQCVENPTMMLGATDLGPGCRKSCKRCHANAGIQVAPSPPTPTHLHQR